MTRRAWSVFVPLTALGAGVLFATSAATAQGTDLRSDRRLQFTELIARERQDVARKERTADQLRAGVAELGAQLAAEDSRIAAAAAPPELEMAAGLLPVRGPGLTVTLDDAPRRPGRPSLCEDPNDCVVHSQDLQAVVNALRAGGADAVTLMGHRIVSTSAVRCVGNVVLVHGKVYSPPYVVTAIGDPQRLRESLNGDPGVRFYRTFVERYDLTYEVRSSTSLELPAYDGPLELPRVQVGA